MKPTRRRRVRKLVLPVVALVLMIGAMGLDAAKRQSHRPPIAIQAR